MKMTRSSSSLCGRIAAILVLGTFINAPASATFQLQLVSQFSPSFVYPAGGGGDAVLPTTSSDGRFVLFASTANTFVMTSTGTPIPVLIPPSMNVYLRDRSSNKQYDELKRKKKKKKKKLKPETRNIFYLFRTSINPSPIGIMLRSTRGSFLIFSLRSRMNMVSRSWL